MSMKRSEIYREAAKNMRRGAHINDYVIYGCCDAITAVVYDHGEAAEDFAEMFRPRRNEAPDTHNLAYWGIGWSDDEDERNDCRILALLFMAAIAEDEE
jgi:hypothetical protein